MARALTSILSLALKIFRRNLATRTVAGYPHSIWQIVVHMSYWMDYELRKIAGEIPKYPDKAIESWPPHPESELKLAVAGATPAFR